MNRVSGLGLLCILVKNWQWSQRERVDDSVVIGACSGERGKMCLGEVEEVEGKNGKVFRVLECRKVQGLVVRMRAYLQRLFLSSVSPSRVDMDQLHWRSFLESDNSVPASLIPGVVKWRLAVCWVKWCQVLRKQCMACPSFFLYPFLEPHFLLKLLGLINDLGLQFMFNLGCTKGVSPYVTQVEESSYSRGLLSLGVLFVKTFALRDSTFDALVIGEQ